MTDLKTALDAAMAAEGEVYWDCSSGCRPSEGLRSAIIAFGRTVAEPYDDLIRAEHGGSSCYWPNADPEALWCPMHEQLRRTLVALDKLESE